MFGFLFWPLTLLKWVIVSLLALLVAFTCALTVTGFWGDKGWLWDLSSHFRLLYLGVQMTALMLLILSTRLAKKRRKPGLLYRVQVGGLLVFVMLNLIQVLPYYWPRLELSEQWPGKVKILHSNVFFLNRNAGALAQLIREKDPDILTLAEYTPWWQQALPRTGALTKYPYHRFVPYSEDAIYSKVPFERVDVRYLTTGQDATTRVDLRLLGQPATLLFVHAVNPLRPDWYDRQSRHFVRWVEERPQYRDNLILMGDLNTSPWSWNFRRLVQTTGLRDSQLGSGVQASWPRRLPFAQPIETLPMIPIDHVLVSEKFVVLKREMGPDVGSDHLPVYVELGLRRD